jgi:hypothetical protein
MNLLSLAPTRSVAGMARREAAGYTVRMRTLLLVMVASLAGACVMEEPADELPGASWSEAEIEGENEASAEPDIGRQPPRDDCVANVRGCLASGLSREPGGQPGP